MIFDRRLQSCKIKPTLHIIIKGKDFQWIMGIGPTWEMSA